MAQYFGSVAPTCPSSRDQAPVPNSIPYVTGSMPQATNLASALAAYNYLRGLYNQLTTPRTVNNTYNAARTGGIGVVKDIYKASSWVEQKAKRVKGRYVYFGKRSDGSVDKGMWIVTERIEQMVWYDKTLKSYLVWNYGFKGEGKPIQGLAP